MPRGLHIALAALLLLPLAACHGKGDEASSPASQAAAESSTAPEGTPSAAPSVASSASASGPASASAEPTPTPDPNLLSAESGAIVRRYTEGSTSDPDDIVEHGAALGEGAQGTLVVVYELAGVADLSGVQVWLPSRDSGAMTASIAASTSGPDTGFTDITSLKATTEDLKPVLSVNAAARWLRITVTGKDPKFDGIYAFGKLRPRPNQAPVPSFVVETDASLRYAGGVYRGANTGKDVWHDVVTRTGAGMTIARCSADRYGGDSIHAAFDGRTLTFLAAGTTHRAVLNDEGTMITGNTGGPVHFDAVPSAPKMCSPVVEGAGRHTILVLDQENPANQFGLGEQPLSDVRFTRIYAPMVTPALLSSNDTVVLNMLCNPDVFLTKDQETAINDYVHSGHVAIIWDSDSCGKETNYAFLPYAFQTDNPGAAGAHGKRLIETESDALGSFDPNDKARYYNSKAYADDENNQIGDANTTLTKDEHWCGHLFGTNTNNVNGFMQMYAPYGTGFFVYDGLDHDDSNLTPHQQMRTFELRLTVPADLPCTTKVSQGFVLQPDREGTFTAGTAQTLHFDMELLANQGWKGHVAMSTTGDFTATVTPQQFDLSGGTQPLKIDVAVPASAKAGSYAITVQASDGANTTSQAVIQLNATAPLVKQILTQKRIRLYGIHFDYDSAHIQPRSEPVIKQVADLMKQDPKLRFQIEGHTDSDGGADYNLQLSQRRAQAVVDDLVHRYHIAASRLVAKGFGLTRPVAPNTTDGGKALNRRVELLVL